MQHNRDVSGVVPVIPTPFDTEENLDADSLRGLIDFAAVSGARAVCLPAYGSEFYKLTEAERARVVEVAVQQARGRLQVIAQSNHASSKVAGELARKNAGLGADVISLALPRMFALGEDDQLRYAERVLKAVDVPFLIQDFNPGGTAVGAGFARRLKGVCPNFHYLKLEEPLMGAKVMAIREATGDSVGVLEGWGGMYLLELLPAGICGAMPGLAMCDLFHRLLTLHAEGNISDAFRIFQTMLPQIVYSLQSMEFFHQCEKRLLMARGLLRNAVVRDATVGLDVTVSNYIDALNAQVLAAVKEWT